MKTKIKRHSRSVISVLLAVCMLVSCMTAGMIMTDAAKVGDAVGEWGNNKGNYFCVKIGTVEKWTPIDGSTESAEIDLSSYSDGDTVSFDLYATESNGATPLYFNKSANISATQGSSYTFQTGGSSGSSRNTFTVADKGKIKVKGSWENGSLRLTVSSASGSSAAGSPKTYYYKGDTEGWNGIEMAETSSGSGVYSTAVTFTADSQKFKFYESSKDKWYGHGSSGYPINTSAWGSQLNEGGQNINAPGTGRYILYFRPSDKKAYAEAAPVESTLSIAANIPNATVSANYNGTIINEGGSLANVPSGAQVTITVDPDTAGQVCTAISTTPAGIVSNSGGTWTLTMPETNASIDSVTVGDAAPRTVYFNNYVSQWSKVYVYTKKANGADGNGAAPGMEMTQVGTSSIYSAVIPGDTITIVFSGSDGSSNEDSTHITYKTNTNYGNALPSDYNEYKATAADGTTGEWTTHSNRNNVYTVTAGTSITGNTGLYYNGINATLYDYYTDGEYNDGSANWIKGIKDYEANKTLAEYSIDNGSQFSWNPYRTLNDALSDYAAEKSIPYPLYFGNLNLAKAGDVGQSNLEYYTGSTTRKYTNWSYKINNSMKLDPSTASITGLAADTESNSTIAHSNGAAMMMFDEDWLSQENSTGNPLATILHSSAFPVRKVNANMIYLDISSASSTWGSAGTIAANFHNGNTTSGNKRVIMNNLGGGLYSVNVPSGYTQVEWQRLNPSDLNGNAWNYKNAGAFGSNNKYTYTSVGESWNTVTGSWSNDTSLASSYTYYEYDSTNGTDNAYIQNVKKSDHTATIEYSNTEKAYSAKAGEGSVSTAGFYPFDNMKASDSSHTSDINNINLGNNRPHDLGFGMKLEIPFSLNEHGTVDGTANGIAQTFNFSGDDDLWVYVDGHLVLDLGGAHQKAEGSINFKTKTATSTTKTVDAATAAASTDNGQTLTASNTYSGTLGTWFDSNPEALHTMTIYYMERGMFESNLKFDFSFHAISNLYTTEKKVRTGGARFTGINSGFYVKSSETIDNATGLTKFEASYQNESFTVDHKVSETENGTYAYPDEGFNYAKVVITPTRTGESKTTTTETYTTGSPLSYNLTNDDRAQFNGKFTSGHYFQLTETPAATNKYSYTPTLRVFDDNDKTGATTIPVTPLGNNSFKFRFGESDPNGLKTINVRGQLENEMKHHDLTITKSIGDKTDTDTEFVFRITFNFDYEGGGTDNGYEGYPLYISSDKDPSKTQLDSFSIGGSSALSIGYFKIKAGETITIPKIPEGAKFKIEEILGGMTDYHADPITNYSYGGMTVTGATATPVTGATAVTMTMGTSDVAVTATNVFADNFTISKKILDGMTSTETYNIIINTKETLTVGAPATAYKGPYVIKHADGTTADTSVPSDDTRTECKVTLHPNDEIKIGVVNDTNFEITEEALSSTYRRKFHYVSSTVDNTTFSKASDATDDVKVVDNGVLVKVTSANKRVDINNKAWGYMIEYTYPGYLKRYNTVNQKDDQKYYVSGLFSEADYDDGTVELAEVADHSNNDVAVQGVRFKSDDIQKNFITSHAPYEDNFMTDLTWNPLFQGETGANTNRYFYAKNTGEEVNMKTNAVVTANKQCQVYFKLPFAYDSSNDGSIATPSQDDGGKVLKTDLQQMSVQAPYGKWYTLNNEYEDGNKAKFVSVPREIYKKKGENDYEKYVFLYWSMKTTPTGHDRRTTEEYKRCYYWDFNMTFYQDTIVEPVYALASTVDTNLTPAELEASDTANGGGTNITFLENSRNQWNRNGGNNQEIDSRKPQGDRVYSDFLLSFSWNDDMLRNALSKKITEKREIDGKEVEVTYYLPYTVGNNELHYSGGLVIEKVAAAPEITSTSNIKTQDEYRDLYGDGEGDNLVAAATDFINSGKTSEGNFLLNETFSAAGFDNKNQFEYSTSFANKSHTDLSDKPYKSYVYRAYTYLRDYDGRAATTGNCMVNGANASPGEVSTINGHTGSLLAVSKPVYFTIYEMATIENGTTYTGQGES